MSSSYKRGSNLLLAPTAPRQFVMPFYAVVKLDLPVEWAAVSEDAKIDYVFNMFTSPRLVKLQWDATSAKMPNHPPKLSTTTALQYELHRRLCDHETTRSYPDRSVYNTTLLTPEAAEKFLRSPTKSFTSNTAHTSQSAPGPDR